MKIKSLMMIGAGILALTSASSELHAQVPVPPLYWGLTGNTGTVDGTHFLGSADNVPLTFRVNSQQAGRIDHFLGNTFLGYQSGFFNISGYYNTANGSWSLFSNTTGGYNTSLGGLSLYSNTTGEINTATGFQALYSNTTGNHNTASGYNALSSNTTGNYNTSNGFNALSSNNTGSYNTALGYGANVASGALTNATAIGANATVSSSNSLVLGNNANVGIGTSSPGAKLEVAGQVKITGGSPGTGKVLTSDASGLASWAALPQAGWGLTGNSGTVDGVNFIGTTNNVPFNIRVNNEKSGRIDPSLGNTFFGYQSGTSVSTGYQNTYLGNQTGVLTTTGHANTTLGFQAFYRNTTGYANTAVGVSALFYNSTGSFNTAIGHAVLIYNTTGWSNTGTGHGALANNTTGTGNTGNGLNTLSFNTSGSYNTCIGLQAGYSNSTGNDNTSIGSFALTTNATGSNNTAVGYTADVSTGGLNNATAIGNGAVVNASNKIRFGNAAVTVVEGPVAYTVSDGRFKSNVEEKDVKGLEFIKRLRPVAYNFDPKGFQEFLVRNMPDSTRIKHLNALNADHFRKSTLIRQSGFIAQEMQQAMKESGYDFNGLHAPENDEDNYSIAYGMLTVPLVKAVQELCRENEDLQKQMSELKKQLDELRRSVENPGNSNTPVKAVELSSGSSIILNQNEPNPFAEMTTISYSIPEEIKHAQILFHDIKGRIIKTVEITEKGAGRLQVYASNLSSGIYTYSIIADGKLIYTKKMVKTE